MQGLEKLEIGKAYSYKEICAILGEKETKNREKQYARWNRYFTFKRDGRKYYILSILETPLPDGRSKGNNRKYIDYFKDVIMYYMEDNHEIIYHTKKDWLLNLNVVNKRLYTKPKNLEKDFRHLLTGNAQYYIFNCQMNVEKFINAKFNDAINNLTKDGYLLSDDSYFIIKSGEGERKATNVENQNIVQVTREVMAEMNVKSFLDAKYKKSYENLINEINKRLRENYGIDKAYKLLGLRKVHESRYEYVSDNVEEARIILNKRLNEGLNRYFINRFTRNKEQVEKGKEEVIEKWINGEEYQNIRIPFELEEYYVMNMNAIADEFLSL